MACFREMLDRPVTGSEGKMPQIGVVCMYKFLVQVFTNFYVV
jgi:hypothetical protein